MDPDSTKLEMIPESTHSEVFQETPRTEVVLEATQSELYPGSTKSQVVPKWTQSELDLESTPKVRPSESTRMSTEGLVINTPQRIQDSSPDVKDQTSLQTTSPVVALPSPQHILASVRPSLLMDAMPQTGKAFSNDEPVPTAEKEAIIPITRSTISAKPTRSQDESVLVDKNKKVSDSTVHTKTSQDQARRKDYVQKPPQTSPQEKKEKQKNRNLTSSKWKKQKSSSRKWDYKSGPLEWTHFGRHVQGTRFGRAPRLCPYPCLRSQSKASRHVSSLSHKSHYTFGRI
ncbi:hypothetical protein PRIEUP_LOCUS1157 [Pristimantis euphronides]